jgi:exonuclease SbcC
VLERIASAELARREAGALEEAAKRRHQEARTAADDARVRLDREWKRFDAVRDALAAQGLGPPAPTRRDLHADWKALLDWARQRAPAERDAAAAHRAAADDARARLDAATGRIARACLAAGVDAAARAPRDAAADALAAARAHADRLARDHAAAAALRADLDRLRKDAALARELARLLDARNFERWLMNRALRLLLAGASRVLRDLSAGAYSLALDNRNEFLVIDHRNADERRMARTLSGGETFLASLALALALADHIADLASGGAARLDALFLDEGFGTLDADTLDTVATAIEELGSRGRMVGLVTHVRDLAERIPVRFEVRKSMSASSVVKVVA